MREEKVWKSISAIFVVVPGAGDADGVAATGAGEGTKISRFAWPESPLCAETV